MSSAPQTVYADQPVNTRIKLSALWASMLFVFAYVDLFSLYREDFRADIEAGEISGFTIGQTFLLATVVYIAIPSLMVFATLVMPARLNRVVSVVLSALYALTIAGGAVGEWNYYILGSVLEVGLLGLIGYYAWTWPHANPQPERPVGGGASSNRSPVATA